MPNRRESIHVNYRIKDRQLRIDDAPERLHPIKGSAGAPPASSSFLPIHPDAGGRPALPSAITSAQSYPIPGRAAELQLSSKATVSCGYEPVNHAPGEKTPAIVFFFGGGWSSGSPGQFEQQCKYLAGRGMVAITVEYRVASRHPVHIEDCIEDAKSAIRWVRGNGAKLGVDPDRIASGGGSAGGHLAACVAVMDEFDAPTDDLKVGAKPNAMVLFNPAMALRP